MTHSDKRAMEESFLRLSLSSPGYLGLSDEMPPKIKICFVTVGSCNSHEAQTDDRFVRCHVLPLGELEEQQFVEHCLRVVIAIGERNASPAR